LNRAGLAALALAFACAARAAGPPPASTPAPAGTPAAAKMPFASGPPFDIYTPTPHNLSLTLDTGPARDLLALLTGSPDAPATLRHLKASGPVALALAQEGMNPDDYFGRLVSYVAGTPDELLTTYRRSADLFKSVLDTLESDGPLALALGARRIGSLLPTTQPVKANLVLVPFISTAGFADVLAVPSEGTIYLVADLPRIIGDAQAAPVPREVMLAMLRASSAEAWRSLFAPFRKPPAWPETKAPDVEALLAQTVAEGPPTLFLFPDEFAPITALLEEPIGRAYLRWGRAAEILMEHKRKEDDKRRVLLEVTRGDFWRRAAAIVGASMADALLRRVGREAYLNALAAGPHAVAKLYTSEIKKGPQLPSAVKKLL